MNKAADGVIHKTVDLDYYDWPVDEVEALEKTFPYLGSITVHGNKYDLHGCSKEVLVFNATPHDNLYECVASVPFSKKTVGGLICYHPDYTRVDDRYQGKGIMARIYIAISKLLDIKIRSGDTQSPGSVKLWYKLAKSQQTDMYVYRRKQGWREVYLDNKHKEITCYDVDPYEHECMVAVFSATTERAL